MTRSRFTTRPQRLNVPGRPSDVHRHLLRRLPLASAVSAILAGGAPVVHAASDADTNTLEEVVVTAQKRTENLQDVPISIQALGNEKLEQLNIVNIDDYVKYLSGVTAQYESEVVFHRNRADLEEQGVLFCDMDSAVRDYTFN